MNIFKTRTWTVRVWTKGIQGDNYQEFIDHHNVTVLKIKDGALLLGGKNYFLVAGYPAGTWTFVKDIREDTGS